MSVSIVVATLVLAVAPATDEAGSPGDGLGLLPAPALRASAAPRAGAPSLPPSSRRQRPHVALAAALAAAAGLATRDGRGRHRRGAGAGTVVVVVPGFGTPASGTFDLLVDQAGLPAAAVSEFDWRWVTGDRDHDLASRRAGVEEGAAALAAHVGRLAGSTDRIYLVGHSKGGALIAELIARWDADPASRVPAVVGAALLDPPIAGGLLGDLQRLGHRWPFLPNNGGYDPVTCSWLRCRDTREHLGGASGIEVVVVRNPDAAVTSFVDRPQGLRILDLADDDGPPARELVWSRGSVVGRIVAAHTSPLSHPAVASCLAAELRDPGSCRWRAGPSHGHGVASPRGFRRGGGGAAAF